MSAEIQARLMAGNRCYYALQNVLKIKTYPEEQSSIYKTIIRPAVTYGSEPWTLTKKKMSHRLISGKEKYSEEYLNQYTTEGYGE
jgi:hypothetical protein